MEGETQSVSKVVKRTKRVLVIDLQVSKKGNLGSKSLSGGEVLEEGRSAPSKSNGCGTASYGRGKL